LGGSGRASLTKLASSIRGYTLFSIEITKNYRDIQWKEDLKKVLKMAGAKSKPGEGVVFLFSDTQIVKESFLEDLNNILNTGEVPNLMGPEDFEEIMNDIRNMKKDVPKINTDTRENIMKFFVQNTRDNLHIVLTFSPAGEKLRTRCREFSSIINCCTIDWYDKWPNDALKSVALREYKANENLGIAEFQEKLADLSV
jgi:dynein heavy chain